MFRIESFPTAGDMLMDNYTRLILRIQNELLQVLKDPLTHRALPKPIRTNTLSAIAMKCEDMPEDVISEAIQFLDSQGYLSAYLSGNLFISWGDRTLEHNRIKEYREKSKTYRPDNNSNSKKNPNQEITTAPGGTTSPDRAAAGDMFGKNLGNPEFIPVSDPCTVLSNLRRVCKILNSYALYYDTLGLSQSDHSRATAYEAAYQMVCAAISNTTTVLDSSSEAAGDLLACIGVEFHF